MFELFTMSMAEFNLWLITEKCYELLLSLFFCSSQPRRVASVRHISFVLVTEKGYELLFFIQFFTYCHVLI